MSRMRREPTDAPPLSMAWRCVGCGAYHLQQEPAPLPAACAHCQGSDLVAADPRPADVADDPDDEPLL